jgi:hypothetical protein
MVIGLGRGLPVADHCYTERVFRDVWKFDLGILNLNRNNNLKMRDNGQFYQMDLLLGISSIIVGPLIFQKNDLVT